MLSFVTRSSFVQRRFASQLATQFDQNGYVGNYEVVTQEEMRNIKKNFNALESKSPKGRLKPQEINLHFEYKFLLDLCLHPRVLDAVKAILGPNVVLLSSAIFTKYPPKKMKANYSGDFVGWHQDLKYWGLVNLKPNERIKLCSMWLAIDKASEKNGAMQFISGSHKSGFFEHVQSKTEGNILNENQDMVIGQEWKDKIFQSDLLPGQCTFHDGMLVHGSKATLESRRMGLTAQFCQPSLKMVPMDYTKSIAFSDDFRKPILVSGKDNFGKLKYVKTTEELLNGVQ